MQWETRGARGKSLAEVKRRFDRWRRGCEGCGRIPHELWRLAAEAAAAHGAEETAALLQLNVARLKQWMRGVADEPAPAPATQPQFVELPPLADAAPECTLELEDASGRKLRVSLKGRATAHAVEIGQMLWSTRP